MQKKPDPNSAFAYNQQLRAEREAARLAEEALLFETDNPTSAPRSPLPSNSQVPTRSGWTPINNPSSELLSPSLHPSLFQNDISDVPSDISPTEISKLFSHTTSEVATIEPTQIPENTHPESPTPQAQVSLCPEKSQESFVTAQSSDAVALNPDKEPAASGLAHNLTPPAQTPPITPQAPKKRLTSGIRTPSSISRKPQRKRQLNKEEISKAVAENAAGNSNLLGTAMASSPSTTRHYKGRSEDKLPAHLNQSSSLSTQQSQ